MCVDPNRCVGVFSSRAAAGSTQFHQEPRECRRGGRPRGDLVMCRDWNADPRGQLVPQPQEHRRQ